MNDVSRWIMKRFLLNIIITVCLMAAGCLFLSKDARADNTLRPYDIGMRAGNLFEADNVEIDSMPLIGFYIRRKVSGPFSAMLSLDSFIFDMKAAKMLGVVPSGNSEIYGKTSLLTVSFAYDVRVPATSWYPYVEAGVGVGFTDFDDDDDGNAGNSPPVSDISVKTKPSVEIVPRVSIGVRYAFQSRWFFDAGARYDYHFSDWKISDRISGLKTSIDHFQTLGVYLGFGVNL